MKRRLCWLPWPWHRLDIVTRDSPPTSAVGCRRCGRMWGMHDEVRAFVPWNGE